DRLIYAVQIIIPIFPEGILIDFYQMMAAKTLGSEAACCISIGIFLSILLLYLDSKGRQWNARFIIPNCITQRAIRPPTQLNSYRHIGLKLIQNSVGKRLFKQFKSWLIAELGRTWERIPMKSSMVEDFT